MNAKKLTLAVLASLSVACGVAGLSACGQKDDNNTTDTDPRIYAVYQLYAEAAGSEAMTYEEWYADLLENAKGDKGEPGKDGEPGEPGKDGEPGEPGVSVTDIEIEYTFDSDGNQIMRFKFHMSDGTVQTVDVVVPKVVRDFSLQTAYVPITPEGIPEMYLEVTYVDETYDAVRITEDMISGDYDFTQKGMTQFTVSYHGKQRLMYISVYDPENPEIINARLESSVGSTLIMTLDEVSNQQYNFGDLHWELMYEDGTVKYVDFSKDHITNLNDLTATISGDTPVTLYAECPELDGTHEFYVRVVESIEVHDYCIYYVGIASGIIFCEINNDPDLNGVYLGAQTDYGTVILSEITVDMLPGFKKDEGGDQFPNIIYKGNDTEINLSIFVYEGEPTTVHKISVSDAQYRINGLFPVITARYVTCLEYKYVYSDFEDVTRSIEICSKEFILEQDMIQGKMPDFTTIGEKNFVVKYKEAENDINIYMYDPTVCNIYHIGVNYYDEIEVKSTDNIIDKLVEILGAAKMYINYFEPVNGETYGELPLTEEIIRAADISKVDTKLGGNCEVYFTYGGYKFPIMIKVTVELGEPTCTITSAEENVMLGMYSLQSVELYEGNMAKLTVYGFDGPTPVYLNYYYELSDMDKTIVFTDPVGIKQGIFTVEITGSTGTIGNYNFTKLTPTGTYVVTNCADMSDGSMTEMQLKLYDNGFYTLYIVRGPGMSITCAFAYEMEGNTVKTLVEGSSNFLITGEGTCEMVIDY